MTGAISFGDLVKRRRLELGLSQPRLADRLCATSGRSVYTRSDVSRYEREERIPARTLQTALAAALELPRIELARAARVTRDRRKGPTPPVVLALERRTKQTPTLADRIAESLHQERLQRGWSIRAIERASAKTGRGMISATAVRAYESGKCERRLEYLERYAAALDYSIRVKIIRIGC